MGGAYVGRATTPSSSSPGPSPSVQPGAASNPKLSFVLKSPATVPWCKRFDVVTTGTLPSGYKILFFDAITDIRFHVTNPNGFDGSASPVAGVPGEWTSRPVYISSQYRQHNGQNLLSHGKPDPAGHHEILFGTRSTGTFATSSTNSPILCGTVPHPPVRLAASIVRPPTSAICACQLGDFITRRAS